MRKHRVGLFVLKSAQRSPGADPLAGHPLLVLCPPSSWSIFQGEGDLDVDVAEAVLKSGRPVFSGFESVLIATDASCPSDSPCMTSTVEESAKGAEPAVRISRKVFGKGVSVKQAVAYCMRRMGENQGILLANRKSVASASGDLLELVLD
jgi:hypothetical protein